MPQSKKLSSLKDRLAEAHHELGTILVVTDVRRRQLEDILKKIKESQTSIDDDYSEKRLALQRKLVNYQTEQEKKLEKLKSSITDLEAKQAEATSQVMESNKESATILEQVTKQKSELYSLTRDAQAAQEGLNELRARKISTVNEINVLETRKIALEDSLITETAEVQSAIRKLRQDYETEKQRIEEVSAFNKTELNSLKAAVIAENTKANQARSENERIQADLIQRENALIVKTRALAKEQSDFATQKRRFDSTLQLHGYS